MRIGLLALVCSICSFAQSTKNWAGPLQACASSQDLLKYGPRDLGVYVTTVNQKLATQFAKAMNFWTTVIDMRWHPESSTRCSLQLSDGQPELFDDSTIAKAHLVDGNGLSAWVAFNPKAPLTDSELYLTSIHEIGHLLGLAHNPSASSVMYYTNDAGATLLDGTDLKALSESHKLRRIHESSTVRCTSSHLEGMPPMGRLKRPSSKLFAIFRQPEANEAELHSQSNLLSGHQKCGRCRLPLAKVVIAP